MDKRFYEFGEYRIDRAMRTLLRAEAIVELSPKEFDTL